MLETIDGPPLGVVMCPGNWSKIEGGSRMAPGATQGRSVGDVYGYAEHHK